MFFSCNVFNASIVLRPTDPAVTAVTEVKAILIGPGGENPDPFLEIQLGRETNIQMRNMVCQLKYSGCDWQRMAKANFQWRMVMNLENCGNLNRFKMDSK